MRLNGAVASDFPAAILRPRSESITACGALRRTIARRSVHRPLLGTVLWLEPLTPAAEAKADAAQPRQLLITIDQCVLEADEYQRLRQAIADATHIPVETIALTLSHTHAAGRMSRSRCNLPGGELIGPYLDRLAAQLAELAVQARQTLAPATIVFGTGRCDLAANRDLWDESAGRFVCGYNPQGPTDDALLLGRITDEAGAVRGVLVNYACHPTTLAWENQAISPDWVGSMRETIENVSGGICVFLQGSSGDLGPRDGFVGEAAVADRNGRQVAYAAPGGARGAATGSDAIRVRRPGGLGGLDRHLAP